MAPHNPLLTFAHGDFIWNLYKNARGHLCIKKYDPDTAVWSDEEVLVTDFREEYSLALGDNDNIHLIAEDSTGIFNYYFWDGSRWSKEVQLFPRNPNSTSNLMLAVSAGCVHVTYLSKTEKAKVLVHQYKYAGQWSKPAIINTIGEPCGNAVINSGTNGRIHLVAQEIDGDNYQLCHYAFDPGTNSWQYRYLLTKQQSSNKLDPCILSDRYNNLHLVWLKSDGMHLRVYYRRFRPGGWLVGGWGKEQVISPSQANAFSPILLNSNNRLITMWQQIDGIYYSTSLDWGDTWSNPEKEGQFKDFMKLNYQMGSKLKQEPLDLVRTFSATSPQLVLLAAYTYATRSLKEPEAPETSTEDSKALLRMHNPKALVPKNLQQVQSDTRLYKLTFAMEDVRLTTQQLGDTVKKQTRQINDTAAELDSIKQFMSHLEEKVVVNSRAITNISDKLDNKLDTLEAESLKQVIENNSRLQEMEQKIQQLAGELNKLRNLLDSYKTMLHDYIEEEKERRNTDAETGKRNAGLVKQIVSSFLKAE